jgi:hypothetical protein
MQEDGLHVFECPKCTGSTTVPHVQMNELIHLLCRYCGFDLTDKLAAELATMPFDDHVSGCGL